MKEDMDIEALLKNNLLGEEAEIPTPLFEQIEATVLNNVKRKKRLFILLWMGIGLSLLFIGWLWGKHTATCQCDKHKQNFRINHCYNSTRAFTTIPKKKLDPISLEGNSDVINATSLNKTLAVISNTNDTKEKEDAFALSEINPSIKKEIPSPKNTSNGTTSNTPIPKASKLQKKETLNQITTTYTAPLNDSQTNNLTQENQLNLNNETPLSEVNLATANTKKDSLSIPKPNAIKDTLFVLPPKTTPSIDSLFTEVTIPPASEKDSLSKNQKKETLNENNLILYGGPSLYNLSVFKPYFNSGQLSSRNFNSKGYEISTAYTRKINPHFEFIVGASFNQKESEFNYDLMISEENYFNEYLEGNPIPLENLDDPNSCNCFLAENVSLAYKINSFNIKTGISYTLFPDQKLKIIPQLLIGSNVFTSFEKLSSSVVVFENDLTERFNSLRTDLSLYLGYQITPSFIAGIAPSYTYLWKGKSNLYAKNISELILPVQLKFSF